ncbi:uncharacterized protein IL334_003554 [Kwoniella shivajii]|uniref:RNB domain-containing protein n=1 Tax=Kwoniella shivajii TaxID=564305 RepID=A0ABZ1CXW2_9TREE|nr:hypothetical protein IL334_003554 [Kwoniella shivajii]
MASIRMRPNAGPSRILRRTLATSIRISDSHNQYNSQPYSESSSPAQGQVKHPKTFDFLYGNDWKKPKVPKKLPTPPKKRPRVDPEAYKNLPPLEAPLRERKVEFSLAEGHSNDRRAYFASDVDGELGQDWSSIKIVEEELGLENGRIVECRRSGNTTIGLILASVSLSGRTRLLLLRSSGEIWPISTHDVQFVMPSSLVSPQLASQCWSPELLEAWSQSESKAGLTDEDVQPSKEMLDARRKVAMTLRKVHRETEKMLGRLVAGSKKGGVESIWEKFAPKSRDHRASITAIEAAEFMLNPELNSQGEGSQVKKITIKPNTLPAYAAHSLLMRRPDLFTADQGDMWSTGKFVVRSRAERDLIDNVQRSVDESMIPNKPDDSRDPALSSFIDKAKRAIELSRSVKDGTADQELKEKKHHLPGWTAKDKEYISILSSPLVETRSTQTPPSLALALSIARLISPNSEEVVDRGTLAAILQDMGMILPWDSLELSKLTESENRSMILSSIPIGKVRGEDELLSGNELDELRNDFTSHKVFVIDDPTASELDDGIALERLPNSDDVWVHIHIADPTRFIPPNHPLAKQASVRGSSAYLPEGNKPLFPLEVIMKELSLGAQVEGNNGAQGTLTFSAKLNKSGQVDESKVRMGWIKKPRVVTYAAVDQALGLPTSKSTRPFGGPVSRPKDDLKSTIDSDDLEDLKTLYGLAKTHRANRFSEAGLEWQIPSANVNLLNSPSHPSPNLFDPSSLPSSPKLFSGSLGLDYKVSSSSPIKGMNASGLVAEYMILAGRLAASFCHSRDIPVIYRGSLAPKPLTSEAGTLDALLATRIDGTGIIDPYTMMGSGWYRPSGFIGLSPLQHWIMGFNKVDSGYIRATSPLRRFDDILVHWQIKAHLARSAGIAGESSKGFNRNEVTDLIKRSDEGSKRAKRTGINANKYWQSIVLQRHLNPNNSFISGGLEWEIDENQKVDLREELIAKVIGSTESVPSISGEQTPVIIESLGVQAKMSHQVLSSDWNIGQEVKVKMDEVVAWPNPHINVRLIK